LKVFCQKQNQYKLIGEFLKKLDKKVLSIQISQMFRVGVAFTIAIFFAKVYSDTEIISKYESLILLGSGLTFFWVSGTMTAFIPFFNSQKENQKSLIFNVFLVLVFLSVISAFAFFLVSKSFDNLNQIVVTNFSLFLLFNTPAFFIEYILLVKKRNNAIVIYSIIVFVLHILTITLPIYLYNDFNLSIAILKYLGMLKFFVLLILVIRNMSFSIDKQLVRNFMLKASPIILSILVGGGAEYIDGFIVKFFSTDQDFALFRYGARELPIALILANSLSLVVSGEISKNISNNKQVFSDLSRLKQSSRRLTYILYPLTLVLLIFSDRIFGFVYNDIFIDAARVFDVYLLLLVGRLFFVHTLILGYQKTTLIFYASVIELIINVVLSIVFILLWGIIGVAIATLIGSYIYKILFIGKVKKLGYNLKDFTPVEVYIFGGLLLVVFIIKLLI
jgi:O-antigen/teichoic acid export membrane protein